MTPDDKPQAGETGSVLSEKLRTAVRDALKRGPDAYVQMVLMRNSPPRSNTARLFRGGPKCRVIGEVSKGNWLVDVKAIDLLHLV